MKWDVIIIGAGAAGLMCGIEAGKRGKRVLILDHSEKIAEKIRISGGGRCNFTNVNCAPDKFLSQNPAFCRSALARYSPRDFIAMVERHGIAYHEKSLGQLFCDNSAVEIIDMLLKECADVGVTLQTGTEILSVEKIDEAFIVKTAKNMATAPSLVVATGGLSIPKIGATPFGYQIAEQFGLNVVQPRAGLVPLTFAPETLEMTVAISGVSVDPASVSSESGKTFDEAVLFTHRGLSGPVILQISSYWQPGEDIVLNLAPSMDVLSWLKEQKRTNGKSAMQSILADILPKRLAHIILDLLKIEGRLGDMSDKLLQTVADHVQKWRIRPAGSEGYRTAEVTLGGVDTSELSSKTFESAKCKGLYFIGEVVDVTGHLGGYNFQWAWSSGWCAGRYV